MNVWITIALASLLIACGSSSTGNPTVKVDGGQEAATPHDEAPDDENKDGPCDRRETTTIKVDGGTITFNVPTLCDPTPYIEKGDPPWQETKQ